MKVHFIAIGGSAMHNLAIALKLNGYDVTGSDDEIFEPARGRLKKYDILPLQEGWHADKITNSLDAVILGMHARQDNPELAKARELGIKIYSYPEYLYEASKDKTRIVVAGSHGKTTITSMVLYVMKYAGIQVDYMVGAQLEGFEVMVKLTNESKYIILEGDEYLSSTLDPRPKFHLYKPHIALLSGIAWDHMNVFPTYDNYVSQFEQFIDLIEPQGSLIYCTSDPVVKRISRKARKDIILIPYGELTYRIHDRKFYILTGEQETPLMVFGKHNIQNIQGSWKICRKMGIDDETFLNAISIFTGASRRLQLLNKTHDSAVYKDFAHSPSKLKATIEAIKELYPERELIACLELHTFSSLNKTFLPQYRGCMDLADNPVVYFSHHALALKRLPELTAEEVKTAFADDRLHIYNDSAKMQEDLLGMDYHNKNLLLMSSGNFDGLNMEELAGKVLNK